MKQIFLKAIWCVVLGLVIPSSIFAQSIEKLDLDASGVIDFPDFLYFARAYGSAQILYDFDESGVVDFADFTTFAGLFGQTRQKEIVVSLGDGVDLELIWVDPGTFEMGLSAQEKASYSLRASAYQQVELERGFYLGKYEVTQAQFKAVTGKGHSETAHALARPNHPVVYITWEDTQFFVDELNADSGGALFRVPTEAEWEYVCKAGTDTRWSFGDDATALGDHAWYKTNTEDVGEPYAHAVGTKLPNPWGFYDMHGNVSERVATDDPYLGNYLVKGGDVTSTSPEGFIPAHQGLSTNPQFNIGFRVVRSADF